MGRGAGGRATDGQRHLQDIRIAVAGRLPQRLVLGLEQLVQVRLNGGVVEQVLRVTLKMS